MRLTDNERLAVLEQKVEHMETQVERMSTKVDQMHEILLQAKGVKIILVLMGTAAISTLGAVAHWAFTKLGGLS